MATIIFYGKPNCVNNNKQKKLLAAAGHVVDDRDILNESWQADTLREYFRKMPVSEWFNRTAPAIKSGTIDIESMTPTEALEAMIADPLLIRRPLMDIDGRKLCGFRFEQIDEMIGLSPVPGQEEQMQTLRSENMTTCPFLDESALNCDERENT